MGKGILWETKPEFMLLFIKIYLDLLVILCRRFLLSESLNLLTVVMGGGIFYKILL